jgi:ATP-binding cassette subfamily B protein
MSEAKKHNPPMRTGARGFEKPKNFKKSISKLLGTMKTMKLAVIISLIFACVGTVLSIIGPKVLKYMQGPIEKYLAAKEQGFDIGIDMSVITHFGIILVIIYISSFLFSSLQSIIMASVTAKVTKKFRSQISEKINRLPLSYFDKNSCTLFSPIHLIPDSMA